MDRISKAHRSWNMSRIRDKNTQPERQVRSLLHKLGYRFLLHRKDLPGRPDIVLPKYRAVIFVNGCFWHRHKNCEYAYTPKSREQFWQTKFENNVRRDHLVQRQLRKLGWLVIVIWECELKNTKQLTTKITQQLQANENVER